MGASGRRLSMQQVSEARTMNTPQWQIRLAHERAVRDALVACGNEAPYKPDPAGGLYHVTPRVFVGAKFWPVMKAAGHDAAEIDKCKCTSLAAREGEDS
jgi:hypothetical protein